ncbi:MAG: hypothetical protein CMJ49_08120 [Planctomycetaceae bacterium]|nr:hypothetical protein [Planctomycetaceae bacterium]
MFHRRLLLMMTLMLLGSAVLVAQMMRLTLVKGEGLRVEAERALVTSRLIPTVRGWVTDRKGRELAVDRPCFDVTVDYAVITGQWAYDRARGDAYREHKARWRELSPEQKDELIAPHQENYDEQVNALWAALAGLPGGDAEALYARRQSVIRRVQSMRSHLHSAWAKQRARELDEPVALRDVADPIRDEHQPHTMLPAVSDETAHEIRRWRARAEDGAGLAVFETVHVEPALTRVYPFETMDVDVDRSTLPPPLKSGVRQAVRVEGVATHIVGWQGKAVREHIERRPYRHADGQIDLGGYLEGDRVGSAGIERGAEDQLRGMRGRVVRHLDTGVEEEHPKRYGGRVRLSIDIMLQARIAGLMDPSVGLMRVQGWHKNAGLPMGTPLNGAAVVMDVETSEVLAMVTRPTFTRGQMRDATSTVVDDPNQPLINRPIAAVRPPGSTMKPIVYCLAATRGLIEWDQVFDCQGYLIPELPNHYRCWKYLRFKLTHGRLGPVQAIAQSCNVYFYESGERLGAVRLVEGLREWGYGRTTGLGLGEESAGLMPSLTRDNPKGSELSVSNARHMGIGQGPLSVPVIQVAAAHAALARGGHYTAPRLVMDDAASSEARDLMVPARAIDNALAGMRASVMDPNGTSRGFSASWGRHVTLNPPSGVVCRAKTGTAQNDSPRWIDGNGNGEQDAGEWFKADHAWYVLHVQRAGESRAKVVIAVLVEYGGSGGRAAGPVANEIMRALMAEGYL